MLVKVTRAATEPDKEVKVKSPQRTEGTLNKVFGHDQTGIEGFDICETGLRNSLNEEKSERDARTEFEGAVRTKRESDAQKGDDDSQERPTLGEQEANDEGKDPHHHRPRPDRSGQLPREQGDHAVSQIEGNHPNDLAVHHRTGQNDR